MVNAANKDKDYQWLLEHKPENAAVTDLSPSTALIAVQGPNALPVTEKALDYQLESMRYYAFADLLYKNEVFAYQGPDIQGKMVLRFICHCIWHPAVGRAARSGRLMGSTGWLGSSGYTKTGNADVAVWK